MKILKNWTDSKRKDLKIIPMMKAIGFEVDFNHQDKMFKRTTLEYPPAYAVRFIKGDYHIWQIKDGWQTANLKGGSFINHKPLETIEEFIITELMKIR